MPDRDIPAVLSIAGSDSGGGAGIQADLKAFARCGVHGMTAITALTAQNTLGVSAVHTDAAGDDRRAGAAGGRRTSASTRSRSGCSALPRRCAPSRRRSGLLEPGTPVVIDPVMVAESGAVLLDDAARAALVEQLLPLATVITPNLPEARVLAQSDPDADAAGARPRPSAASARRPSSSPAAIATRSSTSSSTATRSRQLSGPRHPDGAAHGSGCTHSSALAAHLALGLTPLEAARAARAIASEAVRDGLRELGGGPGPVDVFGLRQRAGVGATGPRRAAAPLA